MFDKHIPQLIIISVIQILVTHSIFTRDLRGTLFSFENVNTNKKRSVTILRCGLLLRGAVALDTIVVSSFLLGDTRRSLSVTCTKRISIFKDLAPNHLSSTASTLAFNNNNRDTMSSYSTTATQSRSIHTQNTHIFKNVINLQRQI